MQYETMKSNQIDFTFESKNFSSIFGLYLFSLGAVFSGYSLYLLLESIGGTERNIISWTGQGLFWFLKISKIGENSKEIIPYIIKDITMNFQWPKSQRWGLSKMKWVRPLKNVNVLFNDEPLIFKIDTDSNIITSNKTFGHPLLSSREIYFKNFSEYLSKLKKEYVIVDHILRKKIILNQIEKITNKSKLNI